MPKVQGDITDLLNRWGQGDAVAENELFTRVFPKLRGLARYMLKGERRGHTLQSVDLVHQIYLKMVVSKDRDWQSRQHFFAIAARAMRRYLIDYARGRPNADFIALDGIKHLLPADSAKISLALTVDQLLDRLGETKPEWSALVEMKFFLGLTDEEAAEALGMKLRSMQRQWKDARNWLFEQAEIYRAGQTTRR
jgi:RNA polymerase sigma factor (TIGR02999 family)